MKIKDLCEAERPRERMMAQGASSLGNAELLAVILRSGTRSESALDLSHRLLLKAEGKLSKLFSMNLSKLLEIQGIGPCKAATILSAFELGKRFMKENSTAIRKPVVSARMAFDRMEADFKNLDHEECWVMFLNNHNYVIDCSRLSSGGDSSTTIDIHQIIRTALHKSAKGIILFHNHPAGDPQPSPADVKQTEALHKACKAVQIDFLDHIVIADEHFFSFSEEQVYHK